MITLRELQYLVALDEHRHFGRAAESCFVSQPTLSGQFRKLEQQLDLQLVERNRHQVVITPAGRQIADRAREILAAIKALESQAEALKDPLSGEIHLGLVPTLGPYLLAGIMKPLVSTLPRLRLLLHEQQTSILLQQLDNAELDLLILPWRNEMETFDHFDLFEERLLLAAMPGDPLLKQEEVHLASLKDRLVLTLEDGHCLRDDTMSYCFTAGAREDQRFRATSLETLRFMVASGIGITLIPELAVDPARDTGIGYRHFSHPEPARRIVALVRPGYPRMECVREIVRIIRGIMTMDLAEPRRLSLEQGNAIDQTVPAKQDSQPDDGGDDDAVGDPHQQDDAG